MKDSKEKTGMQEVLPSEDQQKMVRIYKTIMAQVFIRFTPKEERVKWLMPLDDVSEWDASEQEFIVVYRRGGDVKVEIKYYALPYEDFCKEQVNKTLTKVLVEMGEFINLDVLFDTLVEIAMNIFKLMTTYNVEMMQDLRNFMSSFIVDFDEMKLIDLSAEVIFHDSNAFSSRENLCVSTISIKEFDRKRLEAGKEWRGLTLINCTGACEPGKTDWPPEDYILLRDKYVKEEIGKDYNIKLYNAKREACEKLSCREILVANDDHYKGAHEYCMAILRGEI